MYDLVAGSRGRRPPWATLDEVYDMAPYDRYDDAEGFGLREMRGEGTERIWIRTDIDAKTAVLGIVQGDAAVGYPVPVVETASGVVTDRVGGRDLVVTTLGAGIWAFADPDLGVEARNGMLSGDGPERPRSPAVSGASASALRLPLAGRPRS